MPQLGDRSLDISSVQAKESAIRLLTALVKRSPPDEADRLVDAIVDSCGQAGSGPGRRIIMNRDEIRSLHEAGMMIGAHTVHHYNLTCLGTEEVDLELRESRADLETIISAPVRHLAYPDGRTGRHFDGRVAAVAREVGFSSAVTSIAGPASGEYPLFGIPRLGVVPSHGREGRLAFDMQSTRLIRPRDPVFADVRARTDV